MQTLGFTKTKLTASRLARLLQKEGVAADAIHGDKSQLERMQALDAFKDGKITTLVATDVAARGLDIDQLPMVINYEIPHAPEDYVHRIGRTGRAGASGVAISLVSTEEEKYLKEIEKLIKREIPQENAPAVQARPDRPRERATPRPEREREASSRSVASIPARKSHDPWFDRPYEPMAGNASEPQVTVRPQSGQKREIPALLGGLLRKD
ncbi:ATP-dependent RNA helicase RhlE [mine drainage metagenome]|uniref:ATP-dependent RNA helicase RhlE n=1 Tax=mine drainage metagenome TaxID=410659 RepID=A0A1J5QE65_9ZZZZ